MSELSKRIGRIQRREGSGGMGFGTARRDAPRAMLLAAVASSTADAKVAAEAGVDVLLLDAPTAADAARAIKPLGKVCAGARLPSLDPAGAASLREAGCDFVISPAATTASTAVDTEAMGQVLTVADTVSDTTLRALGPLGLDALFVDGDRSTTTIAGQLELVRLASLSGVPLAVAVPAKSTAAELRVLRDSGVAIVVVPRGTAAPELAALIEALKAVPAPRKGRTGGDIAIVPAASHVEADDDELDDPE